MSPEQDILNISIFGSYGRRNADTTSDLDVLVVCRDGGGTQSEKLVRSEVSKIFSIPPSISWYGEAKLRAFFIIGDLFAWHLYRESFPLPGYRPIHEIFGSPEGYRNCYDDVNGLTEILLTIPFHVKNNPQNLIYEMGIVYVCLRNIAMAASSVLADTVDFGRLSPFNLKVIEFPLCLRDYEILVSCRHASTRGTIAPTAQLDVDKILTHSINWANQIKKALKCSC